MNKFVVSSTLLMALALLAACGPKAGEGGGPGAAGGPPPPAEVGVVTVATRAVGLATELPGRLEASRVAQVWRVPPASCKSACSPKAAT